jgi:hypothetical protein
MMMSVMIMMINRPDIVILGMTMKDDHASRQPTDLE